jgi:hypothetical protein
MPEILATPEQEDCEFKASLSKGSSSKALSHKTRKKKHKRAEAIALVVQCLPSMCKVLGSISSICFYLSLKRQK